MKKSKKTNVILSETKNLMRSFTFVQDDNQSGRSMVEMLGVLAVMGVLSVGGVAMYTNAMNKYRANELLNESSKRAVVIATQILSGKSVSSDMINQFDNNGTTFTGVEAVGTNQFKLTLSGVDDDVCTQLKATVGSNTIIQEVGDKCVFLTFNNDLSKGTTSSNTGTGGSEQQDVDLSSENISNDSPCSYSDKYVCSTSGNSGLIWFCENGHWKFIDDCLADCKQMTNSSVKQVCSDIRNSNGSRCFDPNKYTCNSSVQIVHCKDDVWKMETICLTGCKHILGSSMDEVCDEIDY